MTNVWLTIALVAVASATIKAAGPLLLGDRELGPRATKATLDLPDPLQSPPPGSHSCSGHPC